MKITLEINTANLQDVVDAIDTLKPLLPKEVDSLCKEDVKLDKDICNKDALPKESSDTVSKSEYDSIKAELEKAKSLIEELKAEKDNLHKEVESVSEKLKSLELKESIESIDLPDIINDNNEDNKFDEEYVESIKKDYESKIEDLSKKIEFHEGRSNKNFEEVKRLRTLVDNVSFEKRNLEKKINLLEKENEDLKELSIEDNSEEIHKLKSENKELVEKIELLETLKEKLEKDVDFQKNRSKNNWEELKALKADHENLVKENNKNKIKVEELKEEIASNSSKGDMEKLKVDFIQAKSDYENTISELRLSNDKLQNEINLYASKFSDTDLAELERFRKIKEWVCSSEDGATFWNRVESKLN